jgi:PAS domain S-box-containing protein
MVFIQNMEGRILYVNPSVQRITGWTQQEIRKKPSIEWIHPDDRFRALQTVASCTKEENDANIEWRFLCNSGAYIWLETKITTINNEENTPCRLVFSSRDITVRKNFETALLKSEERFRSLIENAPVGISIIRDRNLLFFSREGMRIWGYEDPAEILGRSMEILFSPNCRTEILEIYNKRMKGLPVPSSYETVGVRKDGTEFPFHIDVAFIHLADGLATICYYRDLSEKKRAENALLEREEQLRFTLQGSRDGFFDWNIETDYLVYSSGYTETLGYRVDEFEPHYRMWDSLLHPEDKPSVLSTLQSHLDGKTDFYASEHRLRMKSGEYKWVFARGKVTNRDHNGKPLRMNGSHHDISERKRLEFELRSSRAELEARVAERTIDLQESNTAMKVLLKQQEIARSEIESSIVANIRGTVQPHVNKLKRTGMNKNQMAVVNMLEEDISGILSPFLKHLQIQYPGFTPKEIQIANFVRNGKTSKDIAAQLHLSVRTVDLFRYRIRKKLNITNKSVNLEAHLSAM